MCVFVCMCVCVCCVCVVRVFSEPDSARHKYHLLPALRFDSLLFTREQYEAY